MPIGDEYKEKIKDEKGRTVGVKCTLCGYEANYKPVRGGAMGASGAVSRHLEKEHAEAVKHEGDWLGC